MKEQTYLNTKRVGFLMSRQFMSPIVGDINCRPKAVCELIPSEARDLNEIACLPARQASSAFGLLAMTDKRGAHEG